METRKLPHGNELFSVIGIGMGGIQGCSDQEIEAIVKKAIANHINFFDMCGGAKNIYKPVGNALKGIREKVYMQVHFGAVYDQNGDYGWSRNLKKSNKRLPGNLKCYKPIMWILDFYIVLMKKMILNN